MKCDICSSDSFVNYGDSRTTVCKSCVDFGKWPPPSDKLVPAEIYASTKNTDIPSVVDQIQNGLLVGKKVNTNWFVEPHLASGSTSASDTSDKDESSGINESYSPVRLLNWLLACSLMVFSTAYADSEDRREVADAESPQEVMDAEPRHEVLDAQRRHEVEDADVRREEVSDAEPRKAVQ